MDYSNQISIMQAKQDGKAISFRKRLDKTDGMRKNGWVRNVPFEEFDFLRFEYRIEEDYATLHEMEVVTTELGTRPSFGTYKISVGNHEDQIEVYGSRELARYITNGLNDAAQSRRKSFEAVNLDFEELRSA